MDMSSFHSDTFYKWRWLFSHGAFVIGMMVSLSAVLFCAFIAPLVLNCLQATQLHLLPLWSTDLHWVRIFPLMVSRVQNWRDIDSSSSCETLVCAARLLERGSPPSILGTTHTIWELFELQLSLLIPPHLFMQGSPCRNAVHVWEGAGP